MLGENTLLLAAKLGELLQSKQMTVTTAESCTGGGLAYAITSIPGSSAWFRQSVVTYSNDAKQFQLGVCHKTLNTYGAVSEQTVKEMAIGALDKARASVAISISGVAGPDGGSADKPVGTVWFGFALCGRTLAIQRHFDGDRAAIRAKAIEFALSKLMDECS